MPTKSIRFYTLALLLIDIIAVLGGLTVAYVIRVQWDPRPTLAPIYAGEYLRTFVALLPFWLLTFWALGLYNPNIYSKRLSEYGRLVIASFIGILLLIGYEYIIGKPIFPARLVPVYAGAGILALLVFGREFLRQMRHVLFALGHGIQRVMVIGSSDMTADIIQNISNTKRSGYKVVATVGNVQFGRVLRFEDTTEALQKLKKLRVDTIIHTELYEDSDKNFEVLYAAESAHIQYCFVPGQAEFYSGKNQVDVFLGYPMISVYQTPLIGWGEFAKRIFDLVFIIVFSPVWLPVIAVLILLQKLFNPGPIFFLSPRLGLHGTTINTMKFRSMLARYSGEDAAEIFRAMGRHDLANEYETTRKIKNDPRITWFGHFLRKTSLDELPQIFNVLRGEMSLVGPRPIIKEEESFYKDRAPLLLSVKPGITGLWQVSGRSDLPFKERVKLELYYAQNWSFLLDIKILLKTIGVVLFRKGAE